MIHVMVLTVMSYVIKLTLINFFGLVATCSLFLTISSMFILPGHVMSSSSTSCRTRSSRHVQTSEDFGYDISPCLATHVVMLLASYWEVVVHSGWSWILLELSAIMSLNVSVFFNMSLVRMSIIVAVLCCIHIFCNLEFSRLMK